MNSHVYTKLDDDNEEEIGMSHVSNINSEITSPQPLVLSLLMDPVLSKHNSGPNIASDPFLKEISLFTTLTAFDCAKSSRLYPFYQFYRVYFVLSILTWQIFTWFFTDLSRYNLISNPVSNIIAGFSFISATIFPIFQAYWVLQKHQFYVPLVRLTAFIFDESHLDLETQLPIRIMQRMRYLWKPFWFIVVPLWFLFLFLSISIALSYRERWVGFISYLPQTLLVLSVWCLFYLFTDLVILSMKHLLYLLNNTQPSNSSPEYINLLTTKYSILHQFLLKWAKNWVYFFGFIAAYLLWLIWSLFQPSFQGNFGSILFQALVFMLTLPLPCVRVSSVATDIHDAIHTLAEKFINSPPKVRRNVMYLLKIAESTYPRFGWTVYTVKIQYRHILRSVIGLYTVATIYASFMAHYGSTSAIPLHS